MTVVNIYDAKTQLSKARSRSRRISMHRCQAKC